jgi:hypothetical protein
MRVLPAQRRYPLPRIWREGSNVVPHRARANSYAGAEAANASPLQAVQQDVVHAVNAPSQALTGRPLIGNGANGAAGTGQTAATADG